MPEQELPESKLLSLLDQQVSVPELEASIQQALDQEDKRFFSISLSIPAVDVLAVLEQNTPHESFEYYWEKPTDHFAIAAGGELARVRSTGEERYRHASRDGKELIRTVHHYSKLKHSQAVPYLLGGFSFFNHNVSKHWKEFGAGSFTLPKWLIVRSGAFTILTLTFSISEDSAVSPVLERIYHQLTELDHICSAERYSTKPELDQHNVIEVPDQHSGEHNRWIKAINGAKNQIRKGVFNKIVLARELKIKLDSPVQDTHILNRLRHQYPDCYSFLIRQNGESSFIGCTPERLASFSRNYILTEGLAGSTPRGKTASEDARLESDLLKSQKDLHEHNFVLRAIRQNLDHFSDRVEIPEKPGIKKLSNVQHLFTPIRARIKDGVSKTEVLKNLHPTPAVGGFPKEHAVPYIAHFENFDRGWYAAPLGWINANGDGEFAVAIRSGLIKKDEVRFFAGCGIVEESDPEKEWEETNLKFIPMLSALEYAGK